MNTYGLHLVIVAGGLGSRLMPMTNYIPKFLVNIGKNTGYVEMIRYWSQYSTFDYPEGSREIQGYDPGSLTVIVHSKYAPLVAEYHSLYFKKIPLIIKTVDEANGSAHAILSTCSHLEGKSVLFQWCDVFPSSQIPLQSFDELYLGSNVVFTNYNNSNRYDLVKTEQGLKPRLVSDERGGCFGMYYVSRFTTEVTYADGQDFIEVIEQFGEIREHQLPRIIDFGDLPKLERTRSTADEAREFNSVEFIGNFVLKQATNEQGKKVIGKEIQWYKKLDELLAKSGKARPAVPRAWLGADNSGLFLERLNAEPIWKAWPHLSAVDRQHVLSQVIQQQEALFDLDRIDVSLETKLRDVRSEALQKLLARYAEIEGVLNSFGEVREVQVRTVSQDSMIRCARAPLTRSPVQLIKDLNAAIEQYYIENPEIQYGFVHGDLQLSNSMVNLDTLQVSIIDPRGYFGESVGYGLLDYDRAKLLYSLSGYDLFNYSKDFGIKTLEDGLISFDVPVPSRAGIQTLIDQKFSRIHDLWLAVIWLGLAQYIKNDPVKSVCAHYRGMLLGERLLSQTSEDL